MKPKELARNELLKLWAHREEFWSADVDEEQVIREAPEMYVKHFSGLRLERPMELRDQVPSNDGVAVATVAGSIDRNIGIISIAKSSTFESQRFTLAHEIGHLVMHPGLSLHRDRPYDKGMTKQNRPRQEREADEFAADFLMPPKYLSKVFLDCFGGPIAVEGTIADKDLAFKLTHGMGENIDPVEFVERTPFQRALVVAKTSGYGMTIFSPLCKRFLVSPSAMAFQLVELGLVA